MKYYMAVMRTDELAIKHGMLAFEGRFSYGSSEQIKEYGTLLAEHEKNRPQSTIGVYEVKVWKI